MLLLGSKQLKSTQLKILSNRIIWFLFSLFLFLNHHYCYWTCLKQFPDESIWRKGEIRNCYNYEKLVKGKGAGQRIVRYFDRLIQIWSVKDTKRRRYHFSQTTILICDLHALEYPIFIVFFLYFWHVQSKTISLVRGMRYNYRSF